jgi:hypothetical protein
MSNEQRGWSAEESQGQLDAESGRRHVFIRLAVVFLAFSLLFGVSLAVLLQDEPDINDIQSEVIDEMEHYNFFNGSDSSESARSLVLWWDQVPANLREMAADHPVVRVSNIHPSDYAGPDACKKCHAEKFSQWSQHAHRWMNASLPHDNVKGDFSGTETISYLGGTGSFYRDGPEYRMRLVREQEREYAITQTIGSRFFQYYIGRQIAGPSSDFRALYEQEHVLPFGYWMDEQEWVPVVHVADELPDGQRTDPFTPIERREDLQIYSQRCDVCHTTFPLADLLGANPGVISREIPTDVHFMVADYLDDAHPELKSQVHPAENPGKAEMAQVLFALNSRKASDHAVTQGISCEACHLGAKRHVENPKIKPEFFPRSPHLITMSDREDPQYGRTHRNVNWACGRCHVGNRPQFASGAATWNSTEYTDAMRGSCYSELRCIDCHEPHQGIGKKWSKSPAVDDASCVRCHDVFQQPSARQEHTHHAPSSEGSRCMNCHMPHLNEGLQDVVRTHMITSPTDERMIYENEPNACNLCHLDQSIDWTLKYFETWYGKDYATDRIDLTYANRDQRLGDSWMKSEREAVRLVCVAAARRRRATWAVPQVIEALDDPYLINRQFARICLEDMLGIELVDFGYRFYMTPAERRDPIGRLRAKFGNGDSTTASDTAD